MSYSSGLLLWEICSILCSCQWQYIQSTHLLVKVICVTYEIGFLFVLYVILNYFVFLSKQNKLAKNSHTVDRPCCKVPFFPSLLRSYHFQVLLLDLSVHLVHLNKKLFLELSTLEISTVVPLLWKISIWWTLFSPFLPSQLLMLSLLFLLVF